MWLAWWLSGKESTCNAGDTGDSGSIPGSGRAPLQYSCLENPMDRGSWRVTVHRVSKSWPWLKQLSTCVHMETARYFWGASYSRSFLWDAFSQPPSLDEFTASPLKVHDSYKHGGRPGSSGTIAHSVQRWWFRMTAPGTESCVGQNQTQRSSPVYLWGDCSYAFQKHPRDVHILNPE